MTKAHPGYDLIGDVHGCAAELRQLLTRLGYRQCSGGYYHPARKAVFVGDIIDRGPEIRQALHIVHDMVEAGHAHIVMGNHEFNYLCYFTPGSTHENASYLRAHTPRHFRTLKETIEQLDAYPDEKQVFLDWMLKIPLFLEFEGFRVAHASWPAAEIAWYQQAYASNTLTPQSLVKAADIQTREGVLVEKLLRGGHLRLPNNEVMISQDGFRRRAFRTKFWVEHPRHYSDLVFQPDPLPDHLAGLPLSKCQINNIDIYGPHEKPLFVGHYWLRGEPRPLTHNIACLDYSAVKDGKMVAYRYDGERTLQADKFVWVDSNKKSR